MQRQILKSYNINLVILNYRSIHTELSTGYHIANDGRIETVVVSYPLFSYLIYMMNPKVE